MSSPRSPARASLTRSAVLAAARDLLVAEGLEAVSLRRVAADLGVTAPALYAHVTDKRDLLQGVAEQEFERLIARLDGVDAPDPRLRIRAHCLAYVDHARENPELFRAMFLFRPELTAQPRGDELPLATKAFQAGMAPVVEAIDAGLLAPADPLLSALTIWVAVHGVATVVLAGPDLGRDAEDALTCSVVDAVLAGLSTR